MAKKQKFDKYAYYIQSVQSPQVDAKFFSKIYKKLRGREAVALREDFCGTFILCQEWVRRDKTKTAVGIDLDSEPIEYGRKLAVRDLSEDECRRIDILNQNIFDEGLPSADIVVAQNFSYFLIKERARLKKYFTNVRKQLAEDGIFIIDCFGGSECYEPIEEQTKHKDFIYYWDQDGFDPITNEAKFYIHFKPKGQKKIKKVFSYDWRMWSLPELKDILTESGFSKVTAYWEGTTAKGEGDGKFKPAVKGEDCESWVSYLVSEK